MSSSAQSMSYLSILSWPSGWTHDDRVEALVASAGLGYDHANTEAQFEPPIVLGAIDTIISDEVLRVLHNRGVLALATPLDEFHSYPDPEPIKRIARFPETSPTAFAADDNDEPAWTFTSDHLKLIVAGQVRSVETRTEGQGAMYGARTSGKGSYREARMIKIDRVDIEDVLDLHLEMNGKPRLLRLTGQRTLIRSVEEIDSPPSLLNPPDPIKLIEPFIDGKRIDQSFDSFTPPPRIRLLEGSKKLGIKYRTPEAFGFYSIWLAVVNRALRG